MEYVQYGGHIRIPGDQDALEHELLLGAVPDSHHDPLLLDEDKLITSWPRIAPKDLQQSAVVVQADDLNTLHQVDLHVELMKLWVSTSDSHSADKSVDHISASGIFMDSDRPVASTVTSINPNFNNLMLLRFVFRS